jgi:DNA anti-recombination protein RmuC
MSISSEPATKADIENVVHLIQQLAERIDQRFEAVDRRFEAVDRRFEAVENRLERMNDNLAGIQSQMAGMTRWADRLDRDHSAILATQTAQQRIIDDLAARVLRLEERRQKSN